MIITGNITKNVIREAEVNYYVLQFDTKVISVRKFGITLIVWLLSKIKKKKVYLS